MYELAAVLRSGGVDADIHVKPCTSGVKLSATFRNLPPGAHGFHIHEAGDLRNDGCSGACSHYHKGHPSSHGDKPRSGSAPRHTGDLGNIRRTGTYSYILKGVTISDLVGRSVIVHADEDDLGKGGHEDSHTTGHSGARIACGVLGRVVCHNTTRRKRK